MDLRIDSLYTVYVKHTLQCMFVWFSRGLKRIEGHGKRKKGRAHATKNPQVEPVGRCSWRPTSSCHGLSPGCAPMRILRPIPRLPRRSTPPPDLLLWCTASSLLPLSWHLQRLAGAGGHHCLLEEDLSVVFPGVFFVLMLKSAISGLKK